MRFYLDEQPERFANGFIGNDIFERQNFAKSIDLIVRSAEQPITISLDASWGEGKTSFLKMYEARYKAEYPIIYFDAYKADALADPVTAIAGELYIKANPEKTQNSGENASPSEVSKKFANKIGTLIKQKAFKFSSSLLISILAYKLLGKADFSEFFGDLSGDDIDEIEKNAVGSILQQSSINQYEKSKETITSVQKALEELASFLIENSDNRCAKNVLFIVDELDRCRPDFALGLLEAIKHLFDVKGIIFLLAMDRKQFCEVIKGSVGIGFDANRYLDKFFHISLMLPSTTRQREHLSKYLCNLDIQLNTEFSPSEIDLIEKFIRDFNVPVRQYPKCMVMIAIALSTFQKIDANKEATRTLLVGLAVLHVTKPTAFEELYRYASLLTLETPSGLDSISLTGNSRLAWRCFVSATERANSSVGDLKEIKLIMSEIEDVLKTHQITPRSNDKRDLLVALMTPVLYIKL